MSLKPVEVSPFPPCVVPCAIPHPRSWGVSGPMRLSGHYSIHQGPQWLLRRVQTILPRLEAGSHMHMAKWVDELISNLHIFAQHVSCFNLKQTGPVERQKRFVREDDWAWQRSKVYSLDDICPSFLIALLIITNKMTTGVYFSGYCLCFMVTHFFLSSFSLSCILQQQRGVHSYTDFHTGG